MNRRVVLLTIILLIWFVISPAISKSDLYVENNGSDINVTAVDKYGIKKETVSTTAELKTIGGVVTAILKTQNKTTGKHVEKIIKTHYKTGKIVISDDGYRIKQTLENISVSDIPFIETYYGYQKDYYTPWVEYSRVDYCKDDMCRVVLANFTTKKVWLEYRPIGEVWALVENTAIPSFEEMRQ